MTEKKAGTNKKKGGVPALRESQKITAQTEVREVTEKQALVSTNEGQPNTQTESDLLLRMAIQQDVSIEKLTLLMDLRDRDENRRAEKEFSLRFSEMQKEYVPAFKTKKVAGNSGEKAYSYSPLPVILLVYAPILAKHGFSYRWDEQLIENNEKRINCYLTGYGHTRKSSIELPIAEANKFTNKIQSRGATTEYGRRYTFMNITGCIVADESGSGETPKENPEEIKKNIASMSTFIPAGLRNKFTQELASKSIEELRTLLIELVNLKERCNKILKVAEIKNGIEGKQKVMDGLREITDENDLMDWEAYIEGL